MKHLALHRARSNSTLRATDTTHDASPSVPAFDLAGNPGNNSGRRLRKSKSSPKLGQPTSTPPTPEPVPPLPTSSKSTHRISEFASRFRFFKARRTDSTSGIVDGLLPSSPSSGLVNKLATSNLGVSTTNSLTSNAEQHPPLRLGSKAYKTSRAISSVQARHHRANTAPSSTRIGENGEESLVGLGIVDLRFDVKTGKYGFPSNTFPGAYDMERSRSSSGASSAGDSGGPGTPTETIPSLIGSGDLGKSFARASIDEAGCQEVIGVLGSLFPGRDDELRRPSVDVPIAEGCSPILRPVDSSSRIHPTHSRRVNSTSVASGTPIARQDLPTRSSSLRSTKFNSRGTAFATREVH